MSDSLITEPNRDDLQEYRRERYLELGFTGHQAHVLARTKEQEQDASGRTWTRALYPGKAEAMLKAGASHAIVFAILS